MKINKKKIACFALASALVIPGAIGLAGCEKGHTHAFTSDAFYEVVTEDGVKTARSWKECSCGAEDAHKNVENAIVVSANSEDDNYIQKILDRNINGKTIVLDEGEYTEEIYLQVTRETLTKAYTYLDNSQTYVLGDEVSLDDVLADSKSRFHYLRTIENVVIAGTKNAVLTDTFHMESRAIYNLTTESYETPIDAVRNIESRSYIQHIHAENLTLTGLNFTGSDGRINFVGSVTSGKAAMKNITITNCSLIADNTGTAAGIYITATAPHANFSGLTIKNTHIEGQQQGITSYDMANITISNNEIIKTNRIGVALLTFVNEATERGSVTITNNKIDTCYDAAKESGDFYNDGERAIRINYALNTNLKVENNSFNNCYNEILKASNMLSCPYTFKNNTYNGKSIQDKSSTSAEAGETLYINIPV